MDGNMYETKENAKRTCNTRMSPRGKRAGEKIGTLEYATKEQAEEIEVLKEQVSRNK